MNNSPKLLRALAAFVWLGALTQIHAEENRHPPVGFERIDVHVHVFTNHSAFLELLKRLNLRALNICVVDKHDRGYEEAALQHDQAREQMEETYARDWKYFATDEIIRFRNRDVQGLNLPRKVLRKLYRENARRWIPGLR